jgi:hypothetical protein
MQHVLHGREHEIEAVEVMLGEYTQPQLRVHAQIALGGGQLALNQVQKR